MESELRQALLADTAIAARCGARIYPLVAPQGAQLPHIVYWRVADRRPHLMVADPSLHEALTLYRASAGTYAEARAIGADIVRVLAGYESPAIARALIEGLYDEYEAGAMVYSQIVEVRTWTIAS